MTNSLRRVLGVLSLGLIAILVGFLLRMRAAVVAPAGPDVFRADAPQGDLSPVDLSNHDSTAQSLRSSAGPEGLAPPTSEPSEAKGQAADDELAGIVLTASNRPVPAADIQVSRNVGRDMATMDPAFVQQESVVATSQSDARGLFSIRILPSRCHRLLVRAPGLARAVFPACYAGEFITVHMQPPGRIFGRVSRESDGAPVSQALVRVWTREEPWLELFRGETDALGDYHVDGLGPEKVYLQVIAQTEASPPWISIDLGVGQEVRRDILLKKGIQVAGRVADAITRLPIPGAEISGDALFRSCVRSNSQGEYLLTGLLADEGPVVFARAPNYSRTEETVAANSSAPAQLDFLLSKSHVAVGRVLDDAGNPQSDVYVAAVACERGGSTGARLDWSAVRSDVGGRFELQDLRADVQHSLFVRKELLGTAVFDFPGNEGQTDRIDLGDIVLRPGRTLRGEVIDSDDHPIPGVEVSLRGCNADRGTQEQADRFEVDRYVASRQVHTDSRGRFQFPDLAAGKYWLDAERERHPVGSVRQVDISADSEPKYSRIRIENGLEIRGIAVDPSGAPVQDVVLVVESESPARGTYAFLRNSSDGSFTVSGLKSGHYRLIGDRNPPAGSESGAELVRKSWLLHVAAGTRDVRLVFERAAATAGVVRDSKGLPVEGATVLAADPEDFTLEYDNGLSDADGRFSLTTPAGKSLRLTAHPPSTEFIEPGRPKPIEDPEMSATAIVGAGAGDVILNLPRWP